MKKNSKTSKAGGSKSEGVISKIIPLADRVLIRVKDEKEEENKNEFGIIIPDTVSREKPEQGEVVAVGEGKMTDEGTLLPMRVKVGDKVVFSKYGYDEVKVGDEEYLLVSEGSILAIIN
jgi:chaperonin GroES